MKLKNTKKSSEKRYLAIELTTTQACNFRCEYCFENDYCTPDDNIVTNRLDEVIESLKNLFTSEFFEENFGLGKITFWGGEPTLNTKLIEKVVDSFIDDKRIGFFIYTNASRMKEMLPIFNKLKGEKIKNEPRFTIQISYDGNPVHDMRRKTRSGEPSSKICLEAMKLLKDNDIPFALKATLAQRDFKYLPEIWNDFEKLHNEFGTSYSLTSDYENPEIYKYWDEIEEALLEISKKEYHFYKKHGRFLSNLFKGSKRFCSAGKNMFTIDIDGRMFLCHGCLYSDSKEDLSFSSIFEDDFIEKIKESYDKFFITERQPEECENCVAGLCIRCNTRKYISSNKEEFLDKWYDYTSQKDLCDFYKMLGRIGRALTEILKEEKIWDAHSNVPETLDVQQIQTAQETNHSVEGTKQHGQQTQQS